MIIALGESLIVAGGGLSGTKITPHLAGVGALAVAATCALWWSYFACAKPALDRALAAAAGADRSKLGRDVFSLLHFVIILGVIGFAAAVEEIVTHPADPLAFEGRLALALGLALFTGGMAAALWRGTGQLPLVRALLAVATAVGLVAASGVSPALSLAIALAGVSLLAGWEHREYLGKAASGHDEPTGE